MIEIPEGYVIVRAIVHCKDCKNYYGTYCHEVSQYSAFRKPTDFCSKGERKDE